jgi:hypothetical protein
MTHARYLLAVFAIIFLTPIVEAQVKEPKRADKLDIEIRYRIRADRDERIRQFRALEKYLASLGFVDARKDDPDRDLDVLDPTAERFTGTIPSANVFRVLDDPRVLNILFAPAGHSYPDSDEKPIAIRAIIRSGLLPNQQQLLYGQVLQQLDKLGFRNALGYDTQGFTQLKGTIPLRNLRSLLKDLRFEPSGWFLADVPPDQLLRPFADRNPIRWVEVMALTDPPPPLELAPLPPAQAKFTPELRSLMQDPATKEMPLRVIVFFANSIDDQVEQLRSRLLSAFPPTPKRDATGKPVIGPDGLPILTDGATIDGAIGNLASIRFDRAEDVERFASEPGVISVRIPHEGSETILPLPPAEKAVTAQEALQSSNLIELHRRGYAGAGVKVILIGSDFTGIDKLIGNVLPAKTTLLDMTAELNPDIQPLPAQANRLGTGATAAKAVALAAPDVELVLVRIDPGSFFQLFEIIRVVRGDTNYSDAMRSRLIDLTNRVNESNRKKDKAVAEYRTAFADLSDDEASKTRRNRAKAALDAIIAEQEELSRRIDRFNNLQKRMTTALAGGRLVINTLVWESGFPLDAMSSLSHFLEQQAAPVPARVIRRPGDPTSRPRPPLVWVQASSMAGNSVWGGAFRDSNQNGVMEFAPPGQPLPAGSWTPEMNFLGVQSQTGQKDQTIPAGVRLRFTIQWREPRDPNFSGLDVPAKPVVLRVYRQLDPLGSARPSDEMAEAGRSVGGPYPIFRTENFIVYEQILELTTTVAGRYALVVDTGYQPDPLLPVLRRDVEIHPRIVIETLSAKPGDPIVVFQSYTNSAAGVGIPADSAGAITVGVSRLGEQTGGGTGITLRAKPDLFGPNAIQLGDPNMQGSGVAAAFVGGMGAGLVQAGASGANPFQSSGFMMGKMAVIPDQWLSWLRPIRRPGQ